MADDTKSYQILGRVIAAAAPPLDVMDLKAFDLPAPLTTPTVALEDCTAELAVSLGFKPQSRPFPFEPVQGSKVRPIGSMNPLAKRAGERRAGNHARFNVAGDGNQLTVRLVRHSQTKRVATDRSDLRSMAPFLDPTSPRDGSHVAV